MLTLSKIRVGLSSTNLFSIITWVTVVRLPTRIPTRITTVYVRQNGSSHNAETATFWVMSGRGAKFRFAYRKVVVPSYLLSQSVALFFILFFFHIETIHTTTTIQTITKLMLSTKQRAKSWAEQIIVITRWLWWCQFILFFFVLLGNGPSWNS